ncbi:MAG TPA: cytochrome c oxidase subunit I [Actinomycetota bacterium]|jgi:cytochrome c oxidase subunit 1/cytochrome c oxidase subunit I+III|nr:cytochrome c oxidase subunit I [Actinomycetota bacterium]
MASYAERLELVWHEGTGLSAWAGTVDHKRIGLRYLYTGFLFFVLAGLEATLMRVQLAAPGLELLSPQTYNELFSMHGVTMMFLVATPILSGFGNYFVPLMIGARDMAFPRLNAFGYWVFLGAGVFLNSAFLVGQAPDDGWFNYLPLASEQFTPTLAIDFYALGLIFIGISTTAGAINFIVTILKLRAPGMTLNRIPIFVWGELAFALTVVFALPVLTVANVFLELERKFGFHFYDADGGGDPVLWQHLFWFFGHPEVYLIVLPALGLVSSIIPTFSHRPMVGYTYIVLAELFIFVISFGVWVHHMFAVGLPTIALGIISAASFMVVIPSGTQIFAWLATMVSGRLVLSTAMHFVLGFLVLFVIGGLSGAMFSAVPFDQATTDSYFVVAHFHYVLAGGAMFPMFAGLYYWGPKMLGRLLDERLGKISFWLMFVGFNLTFFPMHIAGLLGQPRRTYTYASGLGWDLHNLLSTIGVFVMAVGILVTFWNWFRSRAHGEPAGEDPWSGDTLEWTTMSPPPEFNFATIPTVRSREPAWDQPELQGGAQPPENGGRPLTDGHTTLATTLADAAPQAIVHMPHASPWPLFLTLALMVAFYGVLLSSWMVAAVGAIASAGTLTGWLWPRGETQET